MYIPYTCLCWQQIGIITIYKFPSPWCITGGRRIKQEGPTPMDTSGVGPTPVTDASPAGLSYATNEGPVQETEDPASSFHFVGGVSHAGKVFASPSAQPHVQTAEEDVWNELAGMCNN